MPLDFSSQSESVEVPTQFQTGFSEVGGTATGVNVNVAGRIGRRATVTPRVTLTDHGALAASRAFADSSAANAFDFAERSHEESTRATLDLGRAAFNFADAAGARQRDTFTDALDLTERVALEQSDFARDIFGDSLSAVTGVLREGQAQLGNVVTNLNAITREQNTSGDERVQDIARVAVYAGVGLAALMVLAFAARRSA